MMWTLLRGAHRDALLLTLLLCGLGALAGCEDARVAPTPPTPQTPQAPAQAATPAAPPDAPTFDVGLVIERVQHAVQEDDAGLWRVDDRAYVASFEAATFRYAPRGAAGQPAGALGWQTLSIRAGERELATAPAARTRRENQVTLAWPEVEEVYLHKAQSVEQLWRFAAAPRGGDVVVEARIEGGELVAQTDRGLHFATAGGGLVSYSPATVLDDAGRRLRVEPRYDAAQRRVQLVVPAAWLDEATGAVVIDPTFQSEQAIDSPVTPTAATGGANTAFGPAVATDGTSFLVTWIEDRSPLDGSGLYATLVEPDGDLVTPAGFALETAAVSSWGLLSAASNGTHWLVAWTDTRSGTTAARVAHIDDTTPSNPTVTGAVIASPAAGAQGARVASAGSDFLVAYQATGMDEDIFYRFVSSAGAPQGGAATNLTNAAGRDARPGLSGAGGKYLLAWEAGSGGSVDISARAFESGAPVGTTASVSGSGTNAAPAPSCTVLSADSSVQCALIWESDAGGGDGMDLLARPASISGGITFGAAATTLVGGANTQAQPQPALVDTTLNLVYTDDTSGTRDVKLRKSVGAGAPTTVDVAATTDAEQSPAVALLADGSVLVAWANVTDGNIEGRAGDQTTLGSAQALNRSANAQTQVRIAASSARFLVVWRDDRAGMGDLYGARVNTDGTVLDASGIAISTEAASEDLPAVCSNGTDFRVVWREGTQKLRHARVLGGSGAVSQVGDVKTTAGTVEISAVSCSAEDANYLAVWRTTDTSDNAQAIQTALINNSNGNTSNEQTLETGAGLGEPAGAGDPNGHLVAWSSGAGATVKGQRVLSNGNLSGALTTLVSGGGATRGEVAAARTGSGYALAWQEISGDAEVHVAHVATDLSAVTPAGGLALTSDALDQEDLSVASVESENVAVVWSSVTAGNRDLAGRQAQVRSTGVNAVGDAFTVAASTTLSERSPQVATTGTGGAGAVAFERFLAGTTTNTERARLRGMTFNRRPVIPDPGAQSHAEGAVVSLNLGASDPDTDLSGYSATGLPDGLSIHPTTGLISGTVSFVAAASSPYTTTVTATDATGLTTLRTFGWTITNTNRAPTISITGPNTVVEGSSIMLTANVDDLDGEAVTVTWDLDNDGMFDDATGLTASYTGPDNGMRTVRARATDGMANTDASTTITVTNANPTITGRTPMNPVAGVEGSAIAFTATATDPAGANDPLTFTWAWGDGTADSTGANPSHTFADNGAYMVTLTVTDGDGGSAMQTFTATIANVNPTITARAPTSPATGVEGAAVAFSVTATDPGGANDPLSYAWAFGDGVTSTMRTPSHAYADNGTYSVTVTVTDGDGGSAMDSFMITISNANPTITGRTPVNPVAGVEGSAIAFTATATDPGGANDPLTFTWAWGDGTANSTGANPSHTFADNGAYMVTLTVTDGDGGSAMQTFTATIANANPTITGTTPVAPVTGQEGSAIAFTATATDPGGANDPLTYTWAWGDGTANSTGATPSHTFADNGPYTVTLTVTDGDGGSAMMTLPVTIDNVAPTVLTATATPAGPNESQQVAFAATASDPGGANDPLTFTWAWGDGTANSTGANVNHTFADNGAFTVTLTVSDGDGGEATRTIPVTVAEVPPTLAAITGPMTRNEGQAGTWASLLGKPNLDVVNWTIVWGDGTMNTTGTVGTGSTSQSLSQAHTFADNRATPYTITFRATDDDGRTVERTVNVTVANVNPTITAMNAPMEGLNEGSALSFTATATDPGGASDPLTYTWAWGDGTANSTGASVMHTFADNGTYTVTLTVADDDGGSAMMTRMVTIANVAPSVTLTGTQSGGEGSQFSYTAAATDPGMDTLSYAWDFGDGTLLPNASAMVNHTFTDQGTYTVRVTVTDEDGGSTVRTLSVTVTNTAPTITNLNVPMSASEGASVTLSATATDPGADPLTYTWSFGDGTPNATGASVTHTWVDNGAFTVTLTVTDGDTGSTSQMRTITVNNLSPQNVQITGSFAGSEGTQFTFMGSATDPGGANDPLTYRWSFGDGTPNATGASVTHTYATNGTYTLTLTVEDDDGGQTTAQREVNVGGQQPTIQTLTGTQSGAEGSTFSFTATATDIANDPITYTWDFGDGTPTVSGLNRTSVTHVYADNANRTLTLTVTDDDGSSTATLGITVTNVSPTLTNGALVIPATGNEGASLTFAAAATDPAGANDPLTFTWVWGDGTPNSTGANATHTYADNGTYMINLSVSDGDGGSAMTSRSITIANVAPSVTTLNGPATSLEGQQVMFTGAATDPGADTLTYTWDFGDGTANVSGVDRTSVMHTFADNGTYTVRLNVQDEDNAIGTLTRTINVTNVAPTITSLTGTATGPENGTFSFTGVVTDPGGARDPITFRWAWGDGTADTVGVGMSTPTHVYGDEGSYTVTLTVTDGDNGTDAETFAVTVTNVAPTITSLTGTATGNEGASFSYTGAASDPGAGDVLTFRWTFGDGTPAEQGVALTNVTHTYADNGSYTVTLTVTDGDGGSDTETFAVTVNNVAPTLNAGNNRTGNEGALLTLNVTATDPAGANDPLTYQWTFGDGQMMTTATSSVGYAWTDNGVYTVSVTVTDGDGGSDTDTLQVTINNVAPSFTSTPPPSGDEGELYTYAPQVTDPGADTFTFVLIDGPSGMSIDEDTGVVTWTPSAAQAAIPEPRYPVLIRVIDDDSGATNQGWTVNLDFMDTDSGGAPDECELLYGLAVDDPADDTADPDMDGLDTATECIRGQDPTTFNGPNAPSPHMPLADAVVSATPVLLVVNNAQDDNGLGLEPDPLTYSFEAYSDPSLDEATRVYQITGIGEQASMTSASLLTALVEDTRYFWRARAHDGFAFGPWSEPSDFVFSATNDAPSAPTPVSPLAVASMTRPTLLVANAVDPEARALRYSFEVYPEGAVLGTDTPLSRSAAPVQEGADAEEGQTGWRLGVDLQENQAYVWRAQAVDNLNLAGPWSAPVTFQVNTTNAPPSAPVALYPPQDGLVSEAEITLIAAVSTDEDLDPLTYTFALYDGADCVGEPLVEVTGVDAPDGAATGWSPAEAGVTFEEDTTYCWSVRANDGDADSAPDTARFLYSAQNDAPEAPTLTGPTEGANLPTLTPAFTWTNPADPEGARLTFTLEIYRDAALTDRAAALEALVQTGGVGATSTTRDALLEDNTSFWARVRAADPAGAQSPWSDAVGFFVNVRNQAPGSPELLAPANGEVFAPDAAIELAWSEVTDPEGDDVTYTLEIFDPSNSRVLQETGLLPAGDGAVTFNPSLEPGGYTWHVTATDGTLSGVTSRSGIFSIQLPLPDNDFTPPTPPEPEAPRYPAPLGGCATAQRADAPALPALLLAAVAALGWLLTRRR